jgi:hypothetical protein
LITKIRLPENIRLIFIDLGDLLKNQGQVTNKKLNQKRPFLDVFDFLVAGTGLETATSGL